MIEEEKEDAKEGTGSRVQAAGHSVGRDFQKKGDPEVQKNVMPGGQMFF